MKRTQRTITPLRNSPFVQESLDLLDSFANEPEIKSYEETVHTHVDYKGRTFTSVTLNSVKKTKSSPRRAYRKRNLSDAELLVWLNEHLEERDLNEPGKPNLGNCMLWTKGITNSGYGCTSYNGKSITTHRLSYVLNNPGEPPLHSKEDIAHICTASRRCCNPAHLRRVSHADNMKDAAKKMTMKHGEDHPNSKLTVAKVRVIKGLLNETDLTIQEIATLFGVVYNAIRKIKLGLTWACIDAEPDYEYLLRLVKENRNVE